MDHIIPCFGISYESGPSGSRNAEYMESLLTISYFPYHIAYIILLISYGQYDMELPNRV